MEYKVPYIFQVTQYKLYLRLDSVINQLCPTYKRNSSRTTRSRCPKPKSSISYNPRSFILSAYNALDILVYLVIDVWSDANSGKQCLTLCSLRPSTMPMSATLPAHATLAETLRIKSHFSYR